MVNQSLHGIGREPPYILKKMWAGDRGNPVPNDVAATGIGLFSSGGYLEPFNRVRIELDARAVCVAESLQLFRQHTFRAVPPVDKRRNHRDTQVRDPVVHSNESFGTIVDLYQPRNELPLTAFNRPQCRDLPGIAGQPKRTQNTNQRVNQPVLAPKIALGIARP